MEEVQNTQTKPRFVANYCLDKNLVSKEQVMSLFDYGLGQIEWHKNTFNEKAVLQEVDVHILKNLALAKERMLEFQNQCSIEETEKGWLLSYPINMEHEDFEEVNESGMRPWLRNYLEDYFIKYVTTGISMSRVKMCVKKLETKKDVKKEMEELEKVSDAFEIALQEAYYKKSDGFWIDGE